MPRSLPGIIVLTLLLAVLAGCQPGEFTHCTSPAVMGRVLAADTHQPIAGVRVWRGMTKGNIDPAFPSKGGELLTQPAPGLTDADGRFALDSQSDFAILRSPGWFSVPVSFERAGYQPFQTNYAAGNVTGHTPAGAPLINAGDVLLQPRGQ